jgi:hypothetical protein
VRSEKVDVEEKIDRENGNVRVIATNSRQPVKSPEI